MSGLAAQGGWYYPYGISGGLTGRYIAAVGVPYITQAINVYGYDELVVLSSLSVASPGTVLQVIPFFGFKLPGTNLIRYFPSFDKSTGTFPTTTPAGLAAAIAAADNTIFPAGDGEYANFTGGYIKYTLPQSQVGFTYAFATFTVPTFNATAIKLVVFASALPVANVYSNLLASVLRRYG